MPESRKMTIAALAMIMALAGCGGATDTAAPATSEAAPSTASADTLPATDDASALAVRQVKLEVLGKGTSAQPIVYHLDTNGTENDADLPWSRTAEIELTAAEQKAGRLITLVSGSVRDANGQFQPAACRITVDGEKVASGKGTCEHLLK
ncbi:MmpS family protein [Nonomuraea harbinensis]|uniref:MmpS family protein n=1 Tax=Nonomuraea harbinensis TaxID=1286938 RepID=A0ABW1BUV3_9ACTN|nr:MmpS family protein [Nonomuraea harbinensis]